MKATVSSGEEGILKSCNFAAETGARCCYPYVDSRNDLRMRASHLSRMRESSSASFITPHALVAPAW